MKVEHRQTTNPRARKPERYAITDLTPAQYEAILRALNGAKETDREAAALYSTLEGVNDGEAVEELKRATSDTAEELKRLQRLLDD